MAERDFAARLEREWRQLEAAAADALPDSPLRGAGGRGVVPLRPLALFARLEQVLADWHDLQEAGLERLAERFVTPAWTVKDVVGHLATWAGEFRSEIETLVDGKTFERAIPGVMHVMGPREFNERHAAAQRSRPMGELLAEFESHTRAVQERIVSLPEASLDAPAQLPWAPGGDPDERWPGSIAFVAYAKCLHDDHHIGRLRGIVEAQRARRAAPPVRRKR